MSLDSGKGLFLALAFLAGSHSVHDPAKNKKNVHTNAFLSPTLLFIHLKIILLQYFQQ